MAISPLQLVFNAVDNASPTIQRITGSTDDLFGAVGRLSFAYNNVQQAIASIAATGQKAYQLLIGQNVELQQQLLATQASLVATNKVLIQGVEQTDPSAAIKALTEPVNEAVRQLRKDSLELVGVTSKDLVPIFQLLAQSSASIGASLGDSSDLAIDFAAALGTLSIPLFQARQEINSIITGQITSDSQLAKSLNLNNQQVNAWKAQGTLVEELTKKLSAFRAGNQLAAQTIDGVSSNIQEVIDEIARTAGEPLLQPIVSGLTSIYNFLQQNQALIQEVVSNVVNFFLEVGNKLGQALAALQPAIKILGEALFSQGQAEASAFASTLMILVDAIAALIVASAPLIEVVANVAKVFAEIANTPLGRVLLQTVLASALLGKAIAALTLTMNAFAVSVALSGGGLAGFKAALIANSPLLGLFAKGLATATLAVNSFTVSMALSGGGVTGFAAAIKGVALPALAAFTAALAPLIALGGAIALTLIIKKTEDLQDANLEIERFNKEINILSEGTFKTATGLKSLNDAERENGKLTKEQQADRQKLQKQATQRIAILKDQLAQVKALTVADDSQRNAQQAQIATIENQIQLLNKLGGGVRLQSLDIKELGNVYQQLGTKVADAENQLKTGGGGDPARFQEAAKQVASLTAKQVELGQVEASVAIARLQRIATDSRVEFETQLQAQQEITKIRSAESQKRVQAVEIEQMMIETAISAGRLSQVEGDRQITEAKRKQLRIQLEAVEAAITAEVELRKKQSQGAIAAIDKQIADEQKKRSEAETKGDKGGVRIANEAIAALEVQKKAAATSVNIDSQRINELRQQQQKFTTDIAKLDADALKKRQAEALKDFDERRTILETEQAQGLITTAQFNQRILELTQERSRVELSQIAERRKLLSKADKEGLEALAAEEAAVLKRTAEARDKFFQDQSANISKKFGDQQAIIESQQAQGVISTQEFNAKSLEIAQERANEELKQVQEKRKLLNSADTQGLTELAAEEARILKNLADARNKFFEEQFAAIAKAQQEALQQVNLSEAQRSTQISELLRDNVITQEKADNLKLNLTKDRIQKELKLEQDGLNQLQQLATSNSKEEKKRQQEITSSRIRIANLTKNLVDNEISQQQALTREIQARLDREIQSINNQATAQELFFKRSIQQQQQLQQFSQLSQEALSQENKLLDARKTLVGAISGFLQGQLQVLSESTNSERDRRKIAEVTAQIRLDTVRQQAKIEAEILELNLQQEAAALEQKRIALEIEKIELRSSQSAARAATLKAQAEQKKIEADPRATTEQREAAKLGVESAVQSEVALATKVSAIAGREQLLAREAKLQDITSDTRRQQQRFSSQNAEDEARLNLANNRFNLRERRSERQDIQKGILNRFGVSSISELQNNIPRIQVGQRELPQFKPISSPSSPAITDMLKELQPKAGEVNIMITNEFKGDATPGQVTTQIIQGVRKELADLGNTLVGNK